MTIETKTSIALMMVFVLFIMGLGISIMGILKEVRIPGTDLSLLVCSGFLMGLLGSIAAIRIYSRHWR